MMSATPTNDTAASVAPERPIAHVRGTRDWLPEDYARLAALEDLLLDRFARAGYLPMRTPVLELTELHERKSGAGIVSKLYELPDGQPNRVCLRPELTASIVRAFIAAPDPPPLPCRISMSGPVFRHVAAPQEGHYREFHQVGVELLGAGGPAADGEVIGLAAWALAEAGLSDAQVRVGHVGLVLEIFERSGLPAAVRSALIERLSEAASEGRDVRALETGLDELTHWLGAARNDEAPPPLEPEGSAGVDRLFRQLVPDVTGRRSGHEILGRLRRKWDLGHSMHDVLARVRDHVHALAELRGPAPEVLARLDREFAALAPASVAGLHELVAFAEHNGIARERITLDLGFGRGIGFYTQMVFELIVPTAAGPLEVCGGGRYDGLARVLGSDRDDRGAGFAFGLERLQAARDAQASSARTAPALHHVDLVVAEKPAHLPEATRLAAELRARGWHVMVECSRTPGEALEHAAAIGIGRVLIVTGPLDGPDSLLAHDLVARRVFRSTPRDLERRPEVR